MKRIILIAVLFCLASAPMAMAQSEARIVTGNNRQQFVKPESEAEAVVRRAEAKHMNSYNSKGNALKPTDLSRLEKQDAQDMKALKEQEKISRAAARRASLKSELEKSRRRVENAEKALDKLLEKQSKERARLEERQSKEAEAGLTAEMRERHEVEMKNLDEKHSRQLMDAQKKINDAMRRYDMVEGAYMDLNR